MDHTLHALHASRATGMANMGSYYALQQIKCGSFNPKSRGMSDDIHK